MLRKTVIALLAVVSIGLLSPTVASARGFGGFGGHGFGGFHGGFGGGGWRGGPAFGVLGLGVGLGLAGAYGGWGYPYGYGYGGYPGYASYYGGDGGCYVTRRRVWTTYGWRFQPIQVCNY